MMELTNALTTLAQDTTPRQAQALLQTGLKTLVLLLSPITPHICHVLWEALNQNQQQSSMLLGLLLIKKVCKPTDINWIIQVNGKLRAQLCLPKELPANQVEEAACANENVQKFIVDKTIKKIVVVPGKLVNIVVA